MVRYWLLWFAMNVSVNDLGSEKADIYAWIDAQCCKNKQEETKDHLESLLPQLHVLSQELSGNLQQCLESFPSFVNHMQLLQLKTRTLAISLNGKNNNPRLLQQDSSSQYDTLAQLHYAKTQMQKCSNALQESASWNQHSRYVLQSIANSNEFGNLATHLAAMRKSLDTLESMPGHDERLSTMNTVSHDVEVALVPKLNELLQEPQLHLSQLQDCMAIFHHLNRENIVQDAYAKRRPAPIHRYWHATAPTDGASLDLFYIEVETFLVREIRYCQQLFNQPLDVVLKLLDATLRPLLSAMKSLLETNPTIFLESFQYAVRFVHQLLVQGLLSWATLTSDQLSTILTIVFEPYHAQFLDYKTIESHIIKTELLTYVPTTSTLHAPSLEEHCNLVWPYLEARIQYAMELLAGAVLAEEFEAIIEGLEVFSKALCDKMKPPMCCTDVIDWSQLHESLAMLKACGAVLLGAQSCQHRLRLRVEPVLNFWQPDPSHSATAPRIQLSPTTKSSNSTDATLNFTIDDCMYADKLPVALAKLWFQKDRSRFQALQLCKEEWTASDDSDERFSSVFREWTLQVQQRTYLTVLTPISCVLAKVPTMSCWIEVDQDSDLPSFNHLPQEYMTTVADLLLSLLPQLEPFAESSGLTQALAASQNIIELSHDAWASVAKIFNVAQDTAYVVLGEQNNFALFSLMIVDTWTFVVASGAMANLLQAISQIGHLSTLGKRQIVCDVTYFENVLNALGVAPHPLLVYYKDRLTETEASVFVPPSIAEKIDLWITRQVA
ncbi:hypothetical protein THRCLA_01026 [Thraustotheca clavata]|uniref:Conserved oligomeric Golgi complex subunit 7 n=1 Tax=Thraustotheca clavata TaxID=74557 RepID=A0A1W0A9I4_9STRA|nr:hypothetical protein THRCLA_01026 [Thraustotheca clavata]